MWRRIVAFFSPWSAEPPDPRLQAVLADLGEAHRSEQDAARDMALSAKRLQARADSIARQTRQRREDRDKQRMERVRSGQISPVTDRLRGLLEEIDRGRR